MSVPLSQMWTVATYVLGQRLRGRQRYPLVLMLEPLFRCNLACAGCGKIQYPGHILRRHLTVEQCLAAVGGMRRAHGVDPGGEPLMYPTSDVWWQELGGPQEVRVPLHERSPLEGEARRGRLHAVQVLSFSVHMDGLREEHDEAVCRDGVYDVAVEAICEALRRGFR